MNIENLKHTGDDPNECPACLNENKSLTLRIAEEERKAKDLAEEELIQKIINKYEKLKEEGKAERKAEEITTTDPMDWNYVFENDIDEALEEALNDEDDFVPSGVYGIQILKDTFGKPLEDYYSTGRNGKILTYPLKSLADAHGVMFCKNVEWTVVQFNAD